MNNEIVILEKINTLPDEIVSYIKKFISIKTLLFLNKTYYILYHSMIKPHILQYENYIRDTIRRDNEFVFEKILNENYKKWLSIKKYNYRNNIFINYVIFTLYYCNENDSIKCKNTLTNFMEEHGLCKNGHKKNIIKHIRWKN